jgi:very-long-chain enoyl-CoA reductase
VSLLISYKIFDVAPQNFISRSNRFSQVLFVHRYSGSMPLPTALLISCYLFYVTMLTYAQQASTTPADSRSPPSTRSTPARSSSPSASRQLLSPPPPLEAAATAGGPVRARRLPALPFRDRHVRGARHDRADGVRVRTAAFLACRSCATRRWYAVKFQEFPTRVRALVLHLL